MHTARAAGRSTRSVHCFLILFFVSFKSPPIFGFGDSLARVRFPSHATAEDGHINAPTGATRMQELLLYQQLQEVTYKHAHQT
jgi:hypothetical protein